MRKILVLLAVLAVCAAGTIVAQGPQEMGKTPAPGATFATGTVVSSSSSSVVLRQDSGDQMVFSLSKATVGNKIYNVGTRIKVSYHLDSNARAIADEIQGVNQPGAVASAPVLPSTVKVTESTPVASTTSETEKVTTTTKTTYEPEKTTTTTRTSEPARSTVTTETAATKLPRTASNLPLVGLIGLLALGAGVAVRFLH